MTDLQAMLSFWGKTHPKPDERREGEPDWKPVLHHLLDVAAAAEAIQQRSRRRLEREAAAFDIAPDALAALSSVLVGVHDLGKFSRAFQVKSPNHWPAVLGERPEAVSGDHWRLSYTLLTHQRFALLSEMFPHFFDSEKNKIAAAVAGHHGRPPSHDADRGGNPIGGAHDLKIGAPAFEAARLAAKTLWELLGAPKIPEEREEFWETRFAWRLAGLTTLADWVGSDIDFFAFEDPGLAPEAYWPRAQAAAARAVEAKGLEGAAPAPFGGVKALYPEIAEPRPAQAALEAMALPERPFLAILEDATGAGKTEAALTLAHRLIAEGRAEGVYFALPTMATANAMFERLRLGGGDAAPYRRLYAPEAKPSLALSHGAAALSEGFAAVRLAGRAAANGDDGEPALAAACADWLADDRRKGFLAEIGAGTIDQALISVLPKKHLALRQYGLAGKVLIVDEAHSYDAYMQRELERLLEFHAAAGGSAIVLSATLTAEARTLLEAAFYCGLTCAEEELRSNREEKARAEAAVERSADAPYPLITVRSKGARIAAPVATARHTTRRVGVERISTTAEALAKAQAAAADGAAVAVIRNAVDDAVEAYRALRAKGADAALFHARFAMADRLEIERAAVADFGKDGRNRAGRILVATQVIEQSLDLDFDVMITDLAPVDLLIQRAGRLWRHQRDGRPVGEAILSVIAPEWRRPEAKTWLAETQPKGCFIYPPSLQWRSAKALFEAGVIDAPKGLRPLVEAAYAKGEVPQALAADALKVAGDMSGAKALAKLNLIDWAKGYGGVGGVGEDQEIGTRLGSETWTFRLARPCGEAIRPWATPAGFDPADRRAWALSEVKIAKRQGDRLEERFAPPKDWGRFDQDKLLALVDEEGAVTLGPGAAAPAFEYSCELGLQRRDAEG